MNTYSVLYDMQPIGLHDQVACCLKDDFSEHIKLVVVSAEGDPKAQVVRGKLVRQAGKLRVVGIFCQRIRDKIDEEPAKQYQDRNSNR